SGPFHVGGVHAQNTIDWPDRSIFAAPYPWVTWRNGSTTVEASPDLTQPRWIAVVDEFGSREAMISAESGHSYSDDDPAIKPGQLSRRVVEMNAAGYVLRDKTWEYRDGQAFVTGGGLGESYVYLKVRDIFPQAESELMSLVASEKPNDPNPDPSK